MRLFRATGAPISFPGSVSTWAVIDAAKPRQAADAPAHPAVAPMEPGLVRAPAAGTAEAVYYASRTFGGPGSTTYTEKP